jgi:hypothetical protein
MGITDANLRNRQPGQPAPRRDRITAAMSWLANCVIEGFAAYAYCHAGNNSADLVETEDFREKQWYEGVQGPDEFASPHNIPWLREDPRKPAERETRIVVLASERRGD